MFVCTFSSLQSLNIVASQTHRHTKIKQNDGTLLNPENNEVQHLTQKIVNYKADDEDDDGGGDDL